MKKYLILLIVAPALIILFFGNAYAQSAKDVLKAFKKVENVITISPSSVKEFLAAFSDAKTEADLFYDSTEAKKRKKFTERIRRAEDAYAYAARFWDLKRNRVPYVHSNDEIMKTIYNKYPDARKSLAGTIQLSNAILYFYAQAEIELMYATSDYKENR
jgi:hypothetical protein